jgi:glycerophosphoryl diester phosphodiesterase
MASFDTLDGQPPIVISHRGASAVRPEHTIEAYRVAIEMGSKFIEPDLVTTRDGVLVARHEHTLAQSTDIADHPEFADREWVIENFTLAELKTLRTVERTGNRRPESAAYDGQLEIATLDEILALVKQHEAETGEKIAIVPELKDTGVLMAKGYDTPQMLVDALLAHGFTEPERVLLSSGDLKILKVLHDRILPAAGIDLTLLLVGNTATLEGLAEIARYADIVAPNISAILPRVELSSPVDGNGDGRAQIHTQLTGEVTDLIANAHAQGLKVIPYTIRAEENSLSLNADGTVQTAADAIRQIIEAGADGFFTDHTDLGVKVVEEYGPGEGAPGIVRLDGTEAADFLQGGQGRDDIFGHAGDDTLRGQDGDDRLSGGAGDDRLLGGAGQDSMAGGLGDDGYEVDSAGDLVVEGAGEGYDRVTAWIDYTLGADVEKLMLTGAAVSGTGNALDNRIIGTGLANTLSGAGGKDTLLGEGGDDLLMGGTGSNRLFGGEGVDRFRFDALGEGAVSRIMDFTAGEDRIELDGAVFTALAGGALAEESLGAGMTAATAAQHLLYDSTSGVLLYDSDGSGGEAAIRIGSVTAGTDLSAADIWVA